jgi:DNA polymerase-1
MAFNLDIELINATDLNADLIIPHIEESKVVFCDTETQGFDPYTDDLLLVQIYVPTVSKVYVIKVDGNKEEVARLFEAGENLPFLEQKSSKPQYVFHNAKFDLKFLKQSLGVNIHEMNVYCTQLAECILTAGKAENLMSHTSLANTVVRRLGGNYKLDKSVRSAFVNAHLNDISDRMIKYAAEDVFALRSIFRQQVKELKDKKLVETAKVEFELSKYVADMELNGVLINIDLVREIMKEQKKELLKSKATLEEMFAPYVEQPGLFDPAPVNFDSPSQLLSMLNRAGIAVEDTSEFTLQTANEPICDEILEYRSHATLIKSFGEKLIDQINPVTGRIHPSFHQNATATGRWSSSGPNMQQIPGSGPGSRLRSAFYAPKGYKFITADYSQIELRILAELSQEPTMIDNYNKGVDAHTTTASVAFGVSPEMVTTDMRKIAKILNFATVYGGGPKAISKGLLKQLSTEEAEIVLNSFGREPDSKWGVHYQLAAVLIDNFFKEMPVAKDYLDRSGEFAINHMFSTTPLGRKRFYILRDAKTPEEIRKQNGGIMRKGMNHPIQGCSADITKIAIINLGKEFEKMDGCKIILQVHDEIVVEVPYPLVEEAAQVQVKAMKEAAEVFIKSIPVQVDYKIDDIWSK